MKRVRVDRKGRVTLPRDILKGLAMSPGDLVLIERFEGGVLIRRVVSKKEANQRLRGVITSKNALGNLRPLLLKRLLHAGE